MRTGLIPRVRRLLGEALRSRVAGPDADDAYQEIWLTQGERWFGPDDPICRVHGDASMYVGGIAALLLQSLHPLAMAGVAGHSGFRGDPWGRLQRTSRYIATTTFGTVEHAERAISRVRGIHTRVKGDADDGRPYAASDPHLLRWVHVAEIWSFLEAYRRFGGGDLSDEDADLYVEQAAHSALLLGAKDVPRTVAELDSALEDYRPELSVTPAAIDASQFLLREPPLPFVARVGYDFLAYGALTVLPDWARAELGLRVQSRAAEAGEFGVAAVRWGMGAFA